MFHTEFAHMFMISYYHQIKS